MFHKVTLVSTDGSMTHPSSPGTVHRWLTLGPALTETQDFARTATTDHRCCESFWWARIWRTKRITFRQRSVCEHVHVGGRGMQRVWVACAQGVNAGPLSCFITSTQSMHMRAATESALSMLFYRRAATPRGFSWLPTRQAGPIESGPDRSSHSNCPHGLPTVKIALFLSSAVRGLPALHTL